jgi:hypothetical protein
MTLLNYVDDCVGVETVLMTVLNCVDDCVDDCVEELC